MNHLPIVGSAAQAKKAYEQGDSEMACLYGMLAAGELIPIKRAVQGVMNISKQGEQVVTNQLKIRGGETQGKSFINGAQRAAEYGKSWNNGSLKNAIEKFSPGVKGIKTSNGKTIYYNQKTGIQVVYDRSGKYFRIENTNLTGKNRYLDLDGTIPNNKVVDGKILGRSKAEYKQITHFNNIDN